MIIRLSVSGGIRSDDPLHCQTVVIISEEREVEEVVVDEKAVINTVCRPIPLAPTASAIKL